MTQVLRDFDGNVWNVKLSIRNGKLYASLEPDEDPYEIDLSHDRILIELMD